MSHDERMVSRLPVQGPQQAAAAPATGPKFLIVIPAEDGTELLRMTEDGSGRLSVSGDESRWDEGAKRFLHHMMQWSGVIGVRWKDEVIGAVEGKQAPARLT